MNTEQSSKTIFMHALMLMHFHKNILDNINIPDVLTNLLIEKTAGNKYLNILLRIIHNICKIKILLKILFVYL